ncbi:MAG: hypothetical protein WAV28_09610 [Sedimentisphaerales bacterium]
MLGMGYFFYNAAGCLILLSAFIFLWQQVVYFCCRHLCFCGSRVYIFAAGVYLFVAAGCIFLLRAFIFFW